MKEITIRDVIIYYTAQAQAYKSCAMLCSKNVTQKENMLKTAKKLSDRAYALSEIGRFIGQSATTEMNILNNFEAEESVHKQKFKEQFGPCEIEYNSNKNEDA